MTKNENNEPGEAAPIHSKSADLLARFEAGDQTAAEEIFARYLDRLTRLARSRLSPKLAGRCDPEDVVMSAWRSFFLAAGSGRFTLNRSGDLWRLLVSITMHKLYRQVRRNRAERRSVDVEQSIDFTNPASLSSLSQEPTPEEALGLAEELERFLAELGELERRIVELRLQNMTQEQIAEDTGRSERTVRRTLRHIEEKLKRRWDEHAQP